MENPYKTLGVAKDASPEEIRNAYRALAKEHHPDLNPGNVAAEEKFKLVSAANDLLSDPERRAKFDRGEIDAAGHERAARPSYRDYAEGNDGRRYSRHDAQSSGWGRENIDDLFSSIFNRDHRATEEHDARVRDENYALTVEFLDSIIGGTRRLTLPDGRILDVKIPPGTTDGQVLRLRQQGRAERGGGPKGDALIKIHVMPHRYFRRDGQDINLELPVTLSEAVLGSSIQIPTPGGPVKMTLPPHSDSGTELRLRGRGVPSNNGKGAGNLYARLKIVIGPLDAALAEFLQAWKPEIPFDPRKSMENEA